MLGARLLILGFVFRFVFTSAHGQPVPSVDEDECLASACPKRGSAMMQKKSHQNEQKSQLRNVDVLFDPVGRNIACHPSQRRTGKRGDLGLFVSLKQCKANCAKTADCNYVSLVSRVCKNCAKIVRLGECTSFTTCERKWTGKHGLRIRGTTLRRRDVETATLPECEHPNYWSFYYYHHCDDLRLEIRGARYCESTHSSEARNACPQCGFCKTTAPLRNCWEGGDLLQRKGAKDEGCGRLSFKSYTLSTKVCDDGTSAKGGFDTGDFDDYNDATQERLTYENFEPCEGDSLEANRAYALDLQ